MLIHTVLPISANTFISCRDIELPFTSVCSPTEITEPFPVQFKDLRLIKSPNVNSTAVYSDSP